MSGSDLLLWQNTVARRLGEFEKFSTLVDIQEMEDKIIELSQTPGKDEFDLAILRGNLRVANWYLSQIQFFLDNVSKENANLSLFKQVYKTIPARMMEDSPE